MNLTTQQISHLEQALEALASATHFAVSLKQATLHEEHVEIAVKWQILHFCPVFQSADRHSSLINIKNKFSQSTLPPLLVCERLSDTMSAQCRTLGLNYIDLSGNAYLNFPTFFLSVQGQKNHESTQPKNSKSVHSASYLRMVYALLTQPDLLNASYRSIADAAQIALGTVGWVFYDLRQRGFILEGKNRKDRVLLAKEKLQREWAINYPIKLRPKLNAQRFHCEAPNGWQKTEITKYHAIWGGEVAASKQTNYLKPQTITLYMKTEKRSDSLACLVRDLRLRADPQGEVEILDAFWMDSHADQNRNLAHPLLVYSDLSSAHDSRSLETAQLIYDQYLKND